jgi:hypothetical protein
VPHKKFDTRLEAGFLHFGVATLCRFLGVLGDPVLGDPWVELGGHRGEGRGREEIARIAMIAKIAEIEKQGLAADLRR